MALTKLNTSSLPAGSVLQVVEGTLTTSFFSGSTSYVDTGLQASITPTSASSKVMVIVGTGMGNTSQAANNNARILRDSTEIRSYSRVAFNGAAHGSAHQIFPVLDSPNTSSQVTYKLQMMTNTGTLRCNESSGDTSTATITLMEIAG